MAKIQLKNVSKVYGNNKVMDDMNLEIQDGSFTVLVGPSGCGKSTTLRLIAGLEEVTSGEIWIGNHLVNEVAPGKRGISMVFQNYALYPTMTVQGNIEFGLENMKIPKAERKKMVDEIVEIVDLTEYLDKKPQNLSGGQRQRVALARAMVKKPNVFIFDEPLSNLDAKLRGQMRTELIQLHKRLGTTFIYVTHDQVEAMSMGDEIVILNKGHIMQQAAPMEVYHNPANQFVAQFIGTPAMNVISIAMLEGKLGKIIDERIFYIGFRPEHVEIQTAEETTSGIHLPCELLTIETLGSETLYLVNSDAGQFQVKSFNNPLMNTEKIHVTIPFDKLYYFDTQGNRVYVDELPFESMGKEVRGEVLI
ncbi:ATP-binding cassette domain-containing protein [Oceanobacillus caeni]|uniref:ABC transporter ATP-binding protein n=1 Tax=Oceanobacillus caeni TaxID=405946 RepID=A0ABR5MI17_9BACI|nr:MULTISPECIES: ATP-binding cassette domain-containing protein [Bacillaceae]KKE78966.1 ABC transporter ATP-binding protein [Bacilli bacterium VT-13-104]PZD83257.1 ABC transporter ATP-binding protein [Bacilli bacterium]KPH73867.1 ABC transporter ATP-binding protein [Oceanobacillus caeni]MBU8791593.1 ATP-binding cassette domain-containing protein [Oceanobacillus caeni]MCR1835592.1 ATP-binding cassette domain-containing protein [Oceanobacillus caeni]